MPLAREVRANRREIIQTNLDLEAAAHRTPFSSRPTIDGGFPLVWYFAKHAFALPPDLAM